VRIGNVILAAGLGTRMKSELPKALHMLMGRTLVERAVATAEATSGERPVLVVGHGRELIREHIGERAEYVVQEELLGTGHAVMQAAEVLAGRADAVLVTYVDMPLLRQETVCALTELYQKAKGENPNVAIAMLTVQRDDSQGFGRIVRDEAGKVVAIIEEADCTPEQKEIRELNPGVYCFDAAWLWENLPHIPVSAKGEYYLTDMVGIAASQGRDIVSMTAPSDEVDGINTRVQLAHAGNVLRRRVLERHMLNGVTILDPATTYIDETVQIEADATILPGCLLQGDTRIGSQSVIGPYSQIVASTIGRGCRVSFSVVEEARMDDHCEIGPFGHLRKGAHLAEGVHMGNFGEVKNSYLGPGVKMGHFSYIGDSQLGSNVNVGAGTITCNFDGVNKNRTVIGDDAFIGSDTLLVAPVTVGAGARTGAGSVVTRDVPDGALVYGVPARAPVKRGGEQDDPAG
jgi:bifunctional UDP-N-acetylglucosamine pyrophosphorylase/glucosamine-1-phosphate N-acetyltransferase